MVIALLFLKKGVLLLWEVLQTLYGKINTVIQPISTEIFILSLLMFVYSVVSFVHTPGFMHVKKKAGNFLLTKCLIL